jgi:hypothetical protein
MDDLQIDSPSSPTSLFAPTASTSALPLAAGSSTQSPPGAGKKCSGEGNKGKDGKVECGACIRLGLSCAWEDPETAQVERLRRRKEKRELKKREEKERLENEAAAAMEGTAATPTIPTFAAEPPSATGWGGTWNETSGCQVQRTLSVLLSVFPFTIFLTSAFRSLRPFKTRHRRPFTPLLRLSPSSHFLFSGKSAVRRSSSLAGLPRHFRPCSSPSFRLRCGRRCHSLVDGVLGACEPLCRPSGTTLQCSYR